MTDTTKLFKKGYKFPIYPTLEQKELLEKSFGCSRFVYNKVLEQIKLEYQQYLEVKNKQPDNLTNKIALGGYDLVKRLPVIKSEYTWLYEISSDILQQSILHLNSSYSKFFKERKGYPKFKKKYAKQSVSLTRNGFKFKDNQFYIAKSKEPLVVGYGRKGHIRDLPSCPSSATICRSTTGEYWISFVCEFTPIPTSGMATTGLDMGLKDFLVTSDSTRIANPKHLKRYEKQLRRAQQSLSKKKKGSINRNKARLKVAKLHERIANLRSNFQHQLSRQLINDNQVIGIETLKVANMVKNRKLSKAISDVSWSNFFNKLIYKSQWSQHCNIVRMDTYYPSSHICSKTKEKLDRKLKLAERSWDCPYCLQKHDRDVNAAINIRDQAVKVVRDITRTTGKQPYGQLILA